jgi:hypothetical protein
MPTVFFFSSSYFIMLSFDQENEFSVLGIQDKEKQNKNTTKRKQTQIT